MGANQMLKIQPQSPLFWGSGFRLVGLARPPAAGSVGVELSGCCPVALWSSMVQALTRPSSAAPAEGKIANGLQVFALIVASWISTAVIFITGLLRFHLCRLERHKRSVVVARYLTNSRAL